MSCMEHKTALRAELTELAGKSYNEAYPVYLELLGEPDYKELCVCGIEVEYFEYEGVVKAVRSHSEDKWGIDLVLRHESDYKIYVNNIKQKGISLAEFTKMAGSMAQEYGVDKSKIRLVTYSWYNGGDEPIKFE